MTSSTVQKFMDELRRAEQTGDVAPLASMFAEGAELHSYTRDRRGRDAASFWKEYLGAFRDVRSTFTRVQDGGKSAVLEWESEGALPGGEPIRYEGVSILDVDGGKVSRFRTYYDSAAFLPDGSKHAGGAGTQESGDKGQESAKYNPR